MCLNQNEESIGRLLIGCLTPAEASTSSQDLKRALADCTPNGHKYAIQTLAAHAFGNEREDVRQLASVLLRRRVGKAWTSLSANDRQQFWTAVTDRLVSEPSDAVRSGLAHVCAAIAKRDFAARGDALLSLLNQLFASANNGHRQVAFIILGCLLDTNMNDMLPHYANVVSTFTAALADLSSPAVLCAMLRAIITAVEGCETEQHFQLLRQITPPLLALVKTAVEKGLEQVTQSAMDCLCEIVQARQIIQESEMPFLIELVVSTVGLCRSLEPGVREQAFTCVFEIAESFPRVFTMNTDLLQGVLKALVSLGTEESEEEELLDPDETSPFRVACRTLDSLALALPASQFFPLVVKVLEPKFASTQVLDKRCALMFTGVLCEGCQNVMRPQLDSLLPLQLAAIKSPVPILRSTASIALGQMAEFLQPEIFRYTEMSLAACGEALAAELNGETGDRVVENLCYALEVFVSNGSAEGVSGQTGPIMSAVMRIFERCKADTVIASALLVVAALAEKCLDFSPYKDGCADLACRLLEEPGACDRVRAAAVQLAGRLVAGAKVEAVVKERIVSLVMSVLQQVARRDEGGEEAGRDDLLIREHCYGFFDALSFVVGDQMLVLLPAIISCVFASLYADETVTSPKDILDGVDAEEDEEDDRRIADLTIRGGAVDQLVAAIDLMTSLYTNISPPHMQCHLQRALEAIGVLHKHFFSEVRSASMRLSQALLFSTARLYPPKWFSAPTFDPKKSVWVAAISRGWQPEFPAVTSLLTSELKVLWEEHLLPLFIDLLLNDLDPEVVGEVARVLSEILQVLGPATLSVGRSNLDMLASVIRSVWGAQHACQNGAACEEDGHSKDAALFEGVSFLLSSLAEVVPTQMALELFRGFQPMLMQLITQPQTVAYRYTGLGAYSDFLLAIANKTPRSPPSDSPHAHVYIDVVLPSLLDGLAQTSSPGLRQNSCVCLAAAFRVGCNDQKLLQLLPRILELLEKAINDYQGPLHESEANALDNIASLLATITHILPKTDPLSTKVLSMMLSALPLKADFQEAVLIASALIYAVMNLSPHDIRSLFVPIAEACIALLTCGRCEEVLREAVTAGFTETIKSEGVVKPSLYFELKGTLTYMFESTGSSLGVSLEALLHHELGAALLARPAISESSAAKELLLTTLSPER